MERHESFQFNVLPDFVKALSFFLFNVVDLPDRRASLWAMKLLRVVRPGGLQGSRHEKWG